MVAESPSAPPLSPQEVYSIIAALRPFDEVFLMGGQAVNFWADHYISTCPEIERLAPFTSKDIDFGGNKEVARNIADRLGGEVTYPEDPFSDTPSSAIVYVQIEDKTIQIDFLNSVIGVNLDKLKEHLVEVGIYTIPGDLNSMIYFYILHPLHCLMSKVCNCIQLKRNDRSSNRQLQVSPLVLREYLNDILNYDEHRKQVMMCIKDLHWYLRRNRFGKFSFEVLDNDPITILHSLMDDERLDPRYRENTLAGFIEDIEVWRSNRQTRMPPANDSPAP